MMIFRPGQRLVIPGAQVFAPRVTSAAASTWWDNNGAISGCVAAYQPKGASDLASSYVNLANPGTNNAAPGTAPTFSSAGWTFNGSSQYLTTGIIPANNQTWSIIVKFSDVPGSGSGFELCGATQSGLGAPYFGLIPRWADGSSYYLNGGFLTKTAKTNGVMVFAGNIGYYNGSAETGTITSAGGTSLRPLYIGSRNNGGTAESFLNGKIQAIAIYSATLTAGEVATLTTLVQAL